MTNNHRQPIRLLVVDDSPFIRGILRKIFESAPGVRVAGEAGNGVEALEMIPRLQPDVVTLDINMPVMDGMTALKHIMLKHPIPAVMLSTLTREGAGVTFDALRYGAVDFIPKPTRLAGENLEKQKQEIIKKVTLAADVEIESVQYLRSPPRDNTPILFFCEDCGVKNFLKPSEINARNGRFRCRGCNREGVFTKPGRDAKTPERVVAVGAAEGGYGALLKIIPRLLPDLPAAFLIVLYEAAPHVDAFVRYIDDRSKIEVRLPHDGESIESGVCYIAPGEYYMTVDTREGANSLRVHPAAFGDVRGSVNMLMLSLADAMERRAAGVILSGAGRDGSEGLNEIGRVGGETIVQEPGTCLCKEMPKSAMDGCKPAAVVPAARMASELNGLLMNPGPRTRRY
ncbi:MAG: response regulator [Desulfobacterales bacterium]|nr:response regulator [Desulfobacterales bacterium]